MVDFLRRDEPSVLLAHFAQRMLTDMSVTDTLPRTAILLVDVSSTLILVVLFTGYSFMFLAVLSIRKVGTTGIRTGALGFARHLVHLLGA